MAGATIELEQASKANFDKQVKKLSKLAPEAAFKGLVRLLFDIKTLAQNKLKFDRHIVTSRLRNSLYVKTLGQKYANLKDNDGNYSDIKGNSFDQDFIAELTEMEGAIGTNVEYAPNIEYMYDSFLYWALKNADVDKRGREISKEILNTI